MSTPDRRSLGPWAWAVGWVAIAVINAAQARSIVENADLATRVAFHVYDLAHFGLLALASVAIAAAATRVGRRHAAIVTLATTAAVALVIGALTLPEDLAGPARRLEARTGWEGCIAWLVGATALVVPIGEIAGRLLARRRLQWLAIVGVIALATLAELLFLDVLAVLHRHAGARLFFAWASAATIAGALARWTPTARIASGGRLGLAGVVAIAAVAAFPMPERVRAAMARSDGSVLFPFASRSHGRVVAAWRPAVAPTGAWFETRENVAEIGPSGLAMPHGSPIVILLTIDAMRADVLDIPGAAQRLPALTALRAEAFDLSQARSPGARTATALSSLFASKYFSQLYWSERSGPRGPEPWPHRDDSERFPGRLGAHGVRTVSFAGNPWLTDEFGAVGGFAEEIVVEPAAGVGPPGTAWASAAEITGTMIETLRHLAGQPPAPAFLYAHLLDAHDPYDSGEPTGDRPWDRYLAEIALVDAQLARLRAELSALGLSDRTILVVSSDHGEAFGEHHSWRHGTTLYDEVVRIPMLIHIPGSTPRRIDTPVSLLDLGPTILDVFGVSTPGTFMGGSLLPLLFEAGPAPTRPIAFEAGHKQAMLVEDGTKVIRDLRHGVIEVYYLPTDPGERENLFTGVGGAHDDALGRVSELFFVHELRRPGYSTPRR